ncbi:MAG TPA: metalloregulator ArsR/SmtB family transcription factor [Polyangiaceae bacterium]|nr:metalloregulator ArsR/SmtB family transcription factor [Polyangiaceae bacterium]
MFAALGDPQRLTLVTRLCREGPLSIARLAEGADISRQAVTKHLHVLADAGVIRGTREGRENVFEIEPRRLKEARGHLERISAQWDAALVRLRKLVE